MKTLPTMLEVMTPFPYTIERAESIKTAIAIMYGKEIRHLPVVDNGKLVGILTDRDIKLAKSVAKHDDDSHIRVDSVCVLDPYIVSYSESLTSVLKHMISEHIGSALIVKNERLVGIFTVTDACKKLLEMLQAKFEIEDVTA